jgi:hypothetical protein
VGAVDLSVTVVVIAVLAISVVVVVAFGVVLVLGITFAFVAVVPFASVSAYSVVLAGARGRTSGRGTDPSVAALAPAVGVSLSQDTSGQPRTAPFRGAKPALGGARGPCLG